MKKTVHGLILLLVLGIMSGALQAAAADFVPVNPQFGTAVMSALNQQNTFPGVRILSFDRQKIVDRIYHYSFVLKIGPGAYDKIGLHRVVKEKAPLVPINTPDAVMTVHGAFGNFEGFLNPGESTPQDHAIAVYLAQENIDVWGIDLRWTLVPADAADLSFMKDWNIGMHLDDIHLALEIARLMRWPASRDHKMLLLGFSIGSQYTYAFAAREAALPATQRLVKGIIPMDGSLVVDPAATEVVEAARGRYQAAKALYKSGIYYNDTALVYKYLAQLGVTAPDEPSAIIPGLTNKQAMLFTATATYLTFTPPQGPYSPWFHFLAGEFDEYGLPLGLQFTNYDYMLDYVFAIPNYTGLLELIEADALWCGAENLPYADHLTQITVPVFYITTAGGEGTYGLYNLGLLASTDKTHLIVQLYPDEAAALDFGHLDLLTADNAQELVWLPIRDWIKAHR
jgi:pimeloyl-ACP methyl ester carboxylesterase